MFQVWRLRDSWVINKIESTYQKKNKIESQRNLMAVCNHTWERKGDHTLKALRNVLKFYWNVNYTDVINLYESYDTSNPFPTSTWIPT